MEQGLVHLYYGDGKGKTTAAIGLAIRAAGAGKKVLFTQFMKGGPTSELHILEQQENIEVLRIQKKFPFYNQMSDGDKDEITKLHNELLETIKCKMEEHKCGVLVLDEITYPYQWNLIDKDGLKNFLKQKPVGLEVILTGRNPDQVLVDFADYITQMNCIRHPYEKNIPSRIGIEY